MQNSQASKYNGIAILSNYVFSVKLNIMKITIIESGYIELATGGAYFSEIGNNVQCVDVDREKIDNLNNGIIPTT